MKRKSYLGVVFAMPTTKGEYLAGVIVREQKSASLGYFFRTVYKKTPNQDEVGSIINDTVLYVKQISDMGLKDGTWIEIGKIDIDKEKWKIPLFVKQDILTKKYYLVEIDEDLDETINERQITEDESRKYYKVGMAGSEFMERFLSKLVYGTAVK